MIRSKERQVYTLVVLTTDTNRNKIFLPTIDPYSEDTFLFLASPNSIRRFLELEAYPGSETTTKAFLSHCWLDKPIVHLFGEDIAAAGVECWLDKVQLENLDSIPHEIATAISLTDYLLAFISQYSIPSRWVQKKLAIGLDIRAIVGYCTFLRLVALTMCRWPAAFQ